jgi:hypothetical protein
MGQTWLGTVELVGFLLLFPLIGAGAGLGIALTNAWLERLQVRELAKLGTGSK